MLERRLAASGEPIARRAASSAPANAITGSAMQPTANSQLGIVRSRIRIGQVTSGQLSAEARIASAMATPSMTPGIDARPASSAITIAAVRWLMPTSRSAARRSSRRAELTRETFAMNRQIAIMIETSTTVKPTW